LIWIAKINGIVRLDEWSMISGGLSDSTINGVSWRCSWERWLSWSRFSISSWSRFSIKDSTPTHIIQTTLESSNLQFESSASTKDGERFIRYM
jgi:hypothetical protein